MFPALGFIKEHYKDGDDMPFWVAICITFVAGAVFGFVMAACLMANGR